jgi:esterase
VPEAHVNRIRLYYKEHGEGAPDRLHSWRRKLRADVGELGRLGRVIAYDRRGCTRSERPEPYERTSVAEQAYDAAGLLDAVAATPAVVIGRSHGGAGGDRPRAPLSRPGAGAGPAGG